MTGADPLELFTVYARPRDMPQFAFVVRRSVVSAAGAVPDAAAHGFDSLDAARASIPPGRVRLPREPGDDPVIVEVWL